MRFHPFVLTLSLGTLILAGCKSAQPDETYRAHYTTTPPAGAVLLPAASPSVPTQSAQPPQAAPLPSHLPD